EQPTAATAALHKFIAVSDRVSAFEDKINTPGQASQSSHTLQVRLHQVRALWDKVEKEYEICSDLIAQEGSLSTLPVLQAKYDYCYSVYETCAAQISETLERVTPQAVQAPPSQPHISSGCRLPPCDTEVFDGDYLRWPTFRDLFTAVYVNNPRLTPVEKLFHLLTKTSGEAKAIVSKSPLTNDGFASAWEALQDRFQNKRLLQYDGVIQEYLDLGHMNEVPSTLNSPTYYLPHHAVIKPESTTTKLRVVFNASSPSANGTSLNDILHAGPVLQSDLTIQILK
ncbi:hypothetical protein KR032_000974, partial [Drosophila birchii]